jgi:NhaP-type Na+/H+ or K+/H+ antiporter
VPADYERPRYRPVDRYEPVPHIPSYLGWAIVVLLFCFWPTGIVAVVYASQVSDKLAAGDYVGARQSSRKAKMWCWITFGIGVAFAVVGLAMLFMMITMTPLVLF